MWAQHYASGPGEKDKTMLSKAEKLRDMGVSLEQSIQALSCNRWDLDKAMESIFD